MNRPLRLTPVRRLPPKTFPWKRLGISFAFIGLLSVAIWGVWHLQGKSGYFVRVAGEDASFKAEDELREVALQQAAKIKLTFADSLRQQTPKLEELGVYISVDKTVENAKSARLQQWLWLQPWRPAEVSLALTVDEAKLQEFLEAKFVGTYHAPMQPILQFNERLVAHEVTSGKPGRGFDVKALSRQIQTMASAPKAATFQASDTAVQPTVSDFIASKVAEAAQFRIQLRLDFLYQDKLVYFPEPVEIASWQQVHVSRDGVTLELTYDKAKIIAFLRGSVEASLNELFGPNGTEAESKQPLTLAEVEALAGDIILALQNAQPLEKELLVEPMGGSE